MPGPVLISLIMGAAYAKPSFGKMREPNFETLRKQVDNTKLNCECDFFR